MSTANEPTPADDARFEAYWQAVEQPRIDQSPGFVQRIAPQIKDQAKQIWDAALSWQPPASE